MKETNSLPPPPGAPGPFSLSDENSRKSSFMISGFKDLTTVRMNVYFDFDSPEEFTTFTSETAGPLQKILANQTNKWKGVILKTVTEAARKYIDNKAGKVRFENEAILNVGKKWMSTWVYVVKKGFWPFWGKIAVNCIVSFFTRPTIEEMLVD